MRDYNRSVILHRVARNSKIEHHIWDCVFTLRSDAPLGEPTYMGKHLKFEDIEPYQDEIGVESMTALWHVTHLLRHDPENPVLIYLRDYLLPLEAEDKYLMMQDELEKAVRELEQAARQVEFWRRQAEKAFEGLKR